LRRVSAATAFERRGSAYEERLERRRGHVAEYMTEKSGTRNTPLVSVRSGSWRLEP
jgi:hypothetical protein